MTSPDPAPTCSRVTRPRQCDQSMAVHGPGATQQSADTSQPALCGTEHPPAGRHWSLKAQGPGNLTHSSRDDLGRLGPKGTLTCTDRYGDVRPGPEITESGHTQSSVQESSPWQPLTTVAGRAQLLARTVSSGAVHRTPTGGRGRQQAVGRCSKLSIHGPTSGLLGNLIEAKEIAVSDVEPKSGSEVLTLEEAATLLRISRNATYTLHSTVPSRRRPSRPAVCRTRTPRISIPPDSRSTARSPLRHRRPGRVSANHAISL